MRNFEDKIAEGSVGGPKINSLISFVLLLEVDKNESFIDAFYTAWILE